ncbi:hypothetical protein H6P81_015072 [Aristolochia fimbriata]|uniref:RRP12-like protein n=1 Tax=Aristolochia fimbriata TaxID=158543 RepID=A0AAV7E7I3_ARIFI|nr:hypothetical protein H6P81_015072 [Aristolochia fimbriata]
MEASQADCVTLSMEASQADEVHLSMEESVDLCESVLARFRNSTREDHQHLCAVISAMSQELKDHKLPSTPISYFGATISSLTRLSSDSSGSDPVVTALLTVLSLAVPRISVSVLRVNRSLISETVERVLGYSSVSIGGVKAGLKCISHLIVAGDKKSWSSVASLYGIILRFITDHRAKVRNQSHSCLCDILKSFQGSSLLAPASEGITSLFERFLLLAGGSRPSGTASTEESKGALEVLYILAAMKDCLPLMPMKFSTNIFKYLKTLLELQQPIVTRHVMNVLQGFLFNASSELSPEVMLDLMCSLASSLTVKERTAEEMTSTARLLHIGVSRVYSLNREICAPKLPYIFSALGEILTCEHEESIHAATEALIGLVDTCIDEKLIYDGLDLSRVNQSGRSGPTFIEKICATIESLLGYQYNAVWDLSFRVVSAMFAKLGDSSVHLMRGSIQSLADMQKLSDEDLIYRKQLLECVGSAVGAMGPKNFLSLLPLNLDVDDLSDANVWLLPVLKQYIVGAHLSFFTHDILGLVGTLQQKSEKLEREGRIVSSRTVDGLVYSLWSLLPAFCNYPVDTAKSFGGLTKALSSALHKGPDLHGLICSSIQILIQQNKRVLEENIEQTDDGVKVHEQRARNLYTKQVAADNLNALRISVPEFFSDLSGVFLKSSTDSGGCLQATIGEFASIADKKFVKRFFSNTMKMLLKVTKAVSEQSKLSNPMQIDDSTNDSSPSLKRIKLLDLAISLLPGLGVEEINLLFVAIEPVFKDEEGFAQKKAYKILSIILKERTEFIGSNLNRLLELMIEVMPFCHFSAKRHRLDCLFFLIAYVVKDSSEQRKHEVISSFLTEIILALKEPNKKTRNRAYDLLVKIGHACGDEDQGGKKENLQQFFSMIAGGLAGDTPHMISAAVKGLARLAYEFSDLISTAYNLLPSAYLLLQRKNREIIKANLGLLKVIVAKSQAEGLQSHLKSMVEGLLKWQDNSKNHFKAKVKLLLEMLVRKCGLDAVKAAMPEEHRKLLTNIRKTKERKERKMSAKSDTDSRSLQSKATTSRLSRWNHTNIFSDFGNEEAADSDTELMEASSIFDTRTKAKSRFTSKGSSLRSARARPAGKSLAEDLSDQLENDPLDLLDRQKTRAALRSSGQLKRKQDMDNDLEVDSDGRLVIREDDGPKKRESTNSGHDTETRSLTSHYSRSTAKSLSERRKKQKTTDAGWAYTGNEYKSKRARGDLKKKGKLEPYAYWPLDRKMLSRREEHKATARKGMASVVKLAKKLEGKSASGALSVNGPKLKKSTRRKGKKSKSS